MQFTNEQFKQFRADLKAAVAELERKYQVDIKPTKINYSDNSFDLKVVKIKARKYMETYKEYTLQYEITNVYHNSIFNEIFEDGIITDNLHWKKDLKEVKKALKNRLTQLTGLINGYINADGSPKAGITDEMVEAWKMEKATLHIVEHTVTISDPIAYKEGKGVE